MDQVGCVASSYEKRADPYISFIGGNAFCFKACDPAGPDAARLCEHRYDRIGCAYNVPNNAKNGVFEACKGDNMDPVGGALSPFVLLIALLMLPTVYTDASGAVQTYTQPDESLGPISTMPYTAKVPQSSECRAFQSAAVYTGLPKPTSTPTPTSSSAAGVTGTSKGTAAGPSKTGGAAASATESSGAGRVGVSILAVGAAVLAVAL